MIKMYGNGVMSAAACQKMCIKFENCWTCIHDDDCSGQLSTSVQKWTQHAKRDILETQEVTRDCQFHSNEVEMAVHEWLQMQ
jgi:hypothetical protein